MDTTSSNKPKVCILYGFSEGHHTGRHLRKSLLAAGFEMADKNQADVLIAHSGGFLTIPKQVKAKTFMYVGATTFHQPPFTSLREKLRFDYNERRQQKQMVLWLMRGARNWFYMPRVNTIRLARGYLRQPDTPPMASQTIVIRNQHDPYCDEACVLKWQEVTTFISTPGGHDDIWQNPDPYVQILTKMSQA